MSVEEYLPTMASHPPKKRVHYETAPAESSRKKARTSSKTSSDDWAAAFHVYFREQVLEAQRTGVLEKGLGDNGKPTKDFERLGRQIGKQWRRMDKSAKKVYQQQALEEEKQKEQQQATTQPKVPPPPPGVPYHHPRPMGTATGQSHPTPMMAPPPGVPFPYQPPPFLPVIPPPPSQATMNATAPNHSIHHPSYPPHSHHHHHHPTATTATSPETTHAQTKTYSTVAKKATVASSSKKKSSKKKRIPKKPTKPLSAFKIFFTLEKEKLLEDAEDGFVEDLTLCIQERWNALSKDDQAFYEAQAERDVRRYQVKLHEYHKALQREQAALERELAPLDFAQSTATTDYHQPPPPEHDSALGAAEVLAALSQMTSKDEKTAPSTVVPPVPQHKGAFVPIPHNNNTHPTANPLATGMSDGGSSVVTPPPPPVVKQETFMFSGGLPGPQHGSLASLPPVALMQHVPHREMANAAPIQQYRPYSSIIGGKSNVDSPKSDWAALPLLPTPQAKTPPPLPTDPALLRPYSSLMRLGAKMPSRRKASPILNKK